MSELTPQATPLKLASHINYNPDVLTCLANLSNDEVFTPPELANQMLDMLPADLWTNKNAKFLDPVTKSGVFLREIVKRLTTGLAQEIPDLQTRINHICTQQVHGIAITELTSLLARRSVYCAKTANSDLSICSAFDDVQGNIRYERTQHTWKDGKCTYCSASEAVYSRDEALETHAYSFIHMSEAEIERVKNMKFDVIIGNPPYQLNVGIEKENYAIAIYQKFVQQAKKLNPRYLSMIIPARWYAGGRGLDDFRAEMLADNRIRTIVDYPNAVDCFPGVDIAGGVCYFLWERDSNGKCNVTTIQGRDRSSTMIRDLKEKRNDTFLRFNESIPILRKVASKNEVTFDALVSPQTPFGLISTFKDYKEDAFSGAVNLHTSSGIKYVEKNNVLRNHQWIDAWKIYISKAYGERGQYPYLFLGKPFIGEPNTCCTQTYLLIGPFDSKNVSVNVITYIRTKFFRFLIMLKKNTQDAMRDKYGLVPVQNFNESWTDEKLYAKYGLTPDEIAFIESMVRPMDLGA